MNRFENTVVIVTGAGSGIGAATAQRFAQEGARVVLAGRTRDKLEKTARGLDAQRTLLHETDVANEQSVQALVEATLARFGQLDVLVNNAGVAAMGKITGSGAPDDWRKVMSIDLDGVFYCCRAALPHLIASKGNIVNVSSVSGLGGDWGMGIYNAAKGAVTNFTRALALDHGSDGVRVNAVCPSLTLTDMTGDIADDEAVMARFRDRVPLGRGAQPAEIAAAIAFLASADAGFVTGVNLPVDGGLSASNGQPHIS